MRVGNFDRARACRFDPYKINGTITDWKIKISHKSNTTNHEKILTHNNKLGDSGNSFPCRRTRAARFIIDARWFGVFAEGRANGAMWAFEVI
ncbi:MAG: hypothetical protein NXH84_18520 [Rhodobacteraceae bacterium]|nr:hypothetical protein [Paracoccaceae bacterium]